MLVQDDNNGLLARITKAQREDEDLKWVLETIRLKECADFVLQHDVLYRKCDDALLLVVPKAMQRDIIKQVHDQGHFATRKVEQILKREYWFSHMREKIERVVRNCVRCILAERKHGRQEGFLRPIPKGGTPLETYHADYLGPIPSTRKSYAHLLVVVDSFTKFTWLYPTKSTTTEETIVRLTKQAATFGNPRRIVTDRGAAFTSNAFKDYCANESIEHVLVTTGVPRGNGQVERVNRIVIPILTKLTAPNPGDWYKCVDRTQQYINSSPTRSTGLSPFELLVGKKMRLKDDVSLREIVDNEIIYQLQEERDELREKAKRSHRANSARKSC
jgi:Integrase core domain.